MCIDDFASKNQEKKTMTHAALSPLRKTGALLFLALLFVLPPEPAPAQTSGYLIQNFAKTTKLYCRVAADYRCAAPEGQPVGAQCRCFLTEANRYTRFGRVVREYALRRGYR
jgi:hypothetical protein